MAFASSIFMAHRINPGRMIDSLLAIASAVKIGFLKIQGAGR
jgi:hypothetical protein